MLETRFVPSFYSTYRARFAARDSRMNILDDAVRGEYHQVDPGADGIVNRSPNLIQIALDDTADAASLIPTIRGIPHTPTKGPKSAAILMEKVGASYFDVAKMELLLPDTVQDVLAFGFAAWVIWPDADQRIPIIEKRDPRLCYPEPGYRPGDTVRRCMFARNVKYSQLPKDFQTKLQLFVEANQRMMTMNAAAIIRNDIEVTLIEWFDEDEFAIFALYNAQIGQVGKSSGGSYIPIELDRQPNLTGICPIVLPTRRTLDGEMRGQFDQVIGIVAGHVRLTALIMDYADQAVYSDVWVKDLIGPMAYGGGAYIELGPNGAIGRVPPAVSSLDVQRDLAALQDAFHLGARWPKARPGQVDQSIASAKFVEASAGVMNTAIRNLHLIMRRSLEQALRICFHQDVKYFPGTKTAAGVLRNQEFIEEYDTKDIDLKNRIRVEYGLGLGHDPQQSAVLNLQYEGAGVISKEFVQENIEGLNDVERERRRIDVQQLHDMAFAMLLQGLQDGSIDHKALIEIAQARESGKDDVFELYKKFIVDPQTAAAAGAVPSGLGAGLQPPGPPGTPPLPGGPGPAAGAPGPQPPVPPAAPQMLSRLSANLPGRQGFLSSNTGG